MINKILIQLVRFIFLICLQVMLLNKIQFNGYVNPYVYVLFILMLPVEIPGWMLLALAFLTGITVDYFSDSGGVHAAATVFMAFCRPGVLKLIAPRDGYETDTNPNLASMGFKWFITYSLILVLLHHSVYFFTEVFRFTEFFKVFLKIILNTFITLCIIIIGEYLFVKNRGSHVRK